MFDAALYFSAKNLKVNPLKNTNIKCPFHDDRSASLSVHGPTGRWKCHAGCGGGGLIEFESKLNKVSRGEAHMAVSKILGLTAKNTPEAVYLYTDPMGRLLFEKIRFPGKNFQFRVKVGDKYEWSLSSVEKKPLYNLKQVITSRFVFVVEGEKDADNLNNALLAYPEYCATCNFDGAGKWRGDYSRYLCGKTVAIIADNDGAGEQHARIVAASLAGLAEGVKIVSLPVPEHGDVSDYLETNTIEDLFKIVQGTLSEVALKKQKKLFTPASEFMAMHTEQPEWLIDGLIQKGGCGMILAEPGGAKSWLAIDLAFSLSAGLPFMGHRCPQRGRVALLTREDHPSLTSWRMGQISRGKGIPVDIDDYLWVNSREEMAQFSLDNDEQMAEILNELENFAPDLIIMDVLNVLHGAEENDNTAMRQVMRQIVNLHERLGRCSIAVLHHESKSTLNRGGSLKKRARGASAIGGWAEWVFAIDVQNPDEPDKSQWVRRVEFESKAGAPAPAVEFMIYSEGSATELKVVGQTPVAQPKPVQQSFLQ